MRKIIFLLFLLFFGNIEILLDRNTPILLEEENDKFKLEYNSSGIWNIDYTIHINDNWSETTAMYDWCSGSGIYADPYRIVNLILSS